MRSRLALMLGIEAVTLAVLLSLALDQYAHKRVDHLGGVNGRGYRGAVVHARAEREVRIAVVGGDFAFGWGMAEAETTAGYLRTMLANALNKSGQAATVVTAVNLGAMRLPAPGYASRLEQFRYLSPDVVCLYVDLADSGIGSVMPPFDSAITHLTGYVPMLPIVLDERGRQLAASNGLAGSLVGAAGRSLRAIDRTLYGWVAPVPVTVAGDRLAAIERALDIALRSTRALVLVIPVPLDARQRDQHDAILTLAGARASSDPRMAVVDLAAQSQFSAPGLRLDGVSYSAGGNSLVAQEVGRVMVELLSRQSAS